MNTAFKAAAALGLVTILGACAQQEEVVVAPAQGDPIYSKSGEIVGYRPVVVNANGSSNFEDFESIDDTAATASGQPSDIMDNDSDG